MNPEDATMRAIAHKTTTTIRNAALLYWELAVSALSLIPRRATR
jgi:hypothetical protein